MAGVSTAVAGTAGSIFGSVSSYGEAEKNAKYADAQRRNALQEGRNNAYLERLQAARKASAKMAFYGAQGVDMNEGTPMRVLASLEADGEASALGALYSGEMKAMEWDMRKKAAKQQGSIFVGNMGASLLGSMNVSGGKPFWDGYLGSGGGTYMGMR